MMFRTPSATTAYSMAAETPPCTWPYGGTMLPTLRQMKRSPGSVCVINSGTTRESAQVMNMARGCCLFASRWNK